MDRAPASLSRLPFASAVLDRVALHSKLALMFRAHASPAYRRGCMS
jgi:hypothetical protein